MRQIKTFLLSSPQLAIFPSFSKDLIPSPSHLKVQEFLLTLPKVQELHLTLLKLQELHLTRLKVQEVHLTHL